MEGWRNPPETNRIRQGPWNSWGALGNAGGYASNLGVRPQLEIIIIPGACGGVWGDGGSEFNLNETPKNISETNPSEPGQFTRAPRRKAP